MTSERDEIIENIRQRLRKHRAYLQRKLGIEWPDDIPPHAPEAAAATAEMFPELDPATLEEFRRTESALRRIRNGKYGMCSQCGNGITGERLEVLPFANRCIQCQLKG